MRSDEEARVRTVACGGLSGGESSGRVARGRTRQISEATAATAFLTRSTVRIVRQPVLRPNPRDAKHRTTWLSRRKTLKYTAAEFASVALGCLSERYLERSLALAVKRLDASPAAMLDPHGSAPHRKGAHQIAVWMILW
jgi:hypothetical protein